MQHLEDDFRSGALPLVLDATLLLQNEGLLTVEEAQRIREDHRYRLVPERSN